MHSREVYTGGEWANNMERKGRKEKEEEEEKEAEGRMREGG
jgi:hypothetical protein